MFRVCKIYSQGLFIHYACLFFSLLMLLSVRWQLGNSRCVYMKWETILCCFNRQGSSSRKEAPILGLKINKYLFLILPWSEVPVQAAVGSVLGAQVEQSQSPEVLGNKQNICDTECVLEAGSEPCTESRITWKVFPSCAGGNYISEG